MAIVTARKNGNTIYISIPAPVCRKSGVKHGDVFELTQDVILPDMLTLKKIGNNNI